MRERRTRGSLRLQIERTGRARVARTFVTSTLPGDGKSVVAAGVAATLRAAGSTVRLARADDGDSAAADAAQLSLLGGVRSSGQAAAVTEIAADTDELVIEAAAATVSANRADGDRVVLVVRAGEADDETLHHAISELQPDGVVINGVRRHGEPAERARVEAAGGVVLGALPQDRHLAAPSVRDIAAAIDGDLSGDEELFDEASRDFVVGPVSAHEGMDYFRNYPDKTVVSRHDRIDIALGALDYEPLCLVMAGGAPTLPYVAERAERESFALIITGLTTPEVVSAVGPLYGVAKFRGARKLQTAVQLVTAAISP